MLRRRNIETRKELYLFINANTLMLSVENITHSDCTRQRTHAGLYRRKTFNVLI